MLSGGRPFAADSQAGLIAAILEHEAPPVSDRVPLAPASLDRIVQKCLAKHPDERWQTARDLKSELIWVREGREEVRRTRRSTVRPHVVACVATVDCGRRIPTLAGARRLRSCCGALPARRRHAQSPPCRSTLPPGVTLYIPINGTSIAIAPDGSRLAFIGVRAGLPSLFIHQLDTGKTDEVADTLNAATPMFSADSQWVAIRTGRNHQEGSGRRRPRWKPSAPGAAGQMAWLSDGRFVRGSGERIAYPSGFPDDDVLSRRWPRAKKATSRLS